MTHVRPTSADVADRAFARRFGRAAAVGAAAPGRVNLIGEHTDYNEGLALPVAIDRFAGAVAAPGGDPHGRWHLRAEDLDEEFTVDPYAARPDEPRPSWSSYVIGTARALAERGVRADTMDVVISSDVPRGAGLSSSAAIGVAVAMLIQHAAGRALAPLEVARACRQAEHEWAGTPCGIMDMLVACCAEPACALRLDCRTESTRPVRLPPADAARLLVVDSREPRALADGAYARLRAAGAEAAAALGVPSLRDATEEMVAGSDLPGPLARCARHVVTENQRVLRAVEALRAGDPAALGAVLVEGHASLRDDLGVTTATLDAIVDDAGRIDGVFGARMTGGGFGGCAIVLCAPRAVREVQRAWPWAFEARAVGPAGPVKLARP